MGQMVTRKTWEEFRAAGLLWWINRILHVFGWAIVYSFDDAGEIKEVYPARVIYRGFDGKSETEGFKKLSEFMVTNAAELRREAYE